MTRYVQHQSGAGQMWEVRLSISDAWQCYDMATNNVYFLPKSEYLEVPAPDHWVDVTEYCLLGADALCAWHNHNCVLTVLSGYRLRKVKMWTDDVPLNEATKAWAFIVERREP